MGPPRPLRIILIEDSCEYALLVREMLADASKGELEIVHHESLAADNQNDKPEKFRYSFVRHTSPIIGSQTEGTNFFVFVSYRN